MGFRSSNVSIDGVWTVSRRDLRWNGAGNATPETTWVVCDSDTVIERFRFLLMRLDEEVRDYELAAVQDLDEGRCRAAAKARALLDGPGMQLARELEAQIRLADPATLQEMKESIEAAIALGAIARRRDLNNWENRDLLLQWCRETLPSLRRAFRDLAVEETVFVLESPAMNLAPPDWTKEDDSSYRMPMEVQPLQSIHIAAA